MAKSVDENIQLTKLSPFKLAKGIKDITKSNIVNATTLNNNYVLLETNNEEQSKLLLDPKQVCKVPVYTQIPNMKCLRLPAMKI